MADPPEANSPKRVFFPADPGWSQRLRLCGLLLRCGEGCGSTRPRSRDPPLPSSLRTTASAFAGRGGGTDGGPIDHPQQCGGRLDPAERSRLFEKVGTREDGCRCPAKRIKPHIKPPYAPAGARAMVSESVRTFAHSWSTNPWDSNRARI